MKFWRRNETRRERKENEWVCVCVCVRVWEFEWVRARKRRKGERFNQALFTFWIKVDLLLNNAIISRPILCLPFPLSRCNLFVVRICFWLRYTLCIHSYSPSLSPIHTLTHTRALTHTQAHTHTHVRIHTSHPTPPLSIRLSFRLTRWSDSQSFKSKQSFFPLWC